MFKKALLLSAVFCLSVSALADDWPVWRGPNQDGISKEKGIKPSTKIAWKKNVGEGYSAVTVCDGKLLTAGHKGGKDTIYCLDPATGREIWKYSYSCSRGNRYPGPRATPITDGKKVWMLSRECELICLDLTSGKKIWHKDLMSEYGADNVRWGVSSSPVLVGNIVTVNVGTDGMAFDKNTGKAVWPNKGGKGSYASPAVFKFKGKAYAAIFSAKSLVVVDASSGKVAASYPWPAKYDISAADPLVSADGQYIFISTGYNTGRGALLKFNGSKLSKVWQNTNMKSQFSSPILIDGVLYGVDGNTNSRKSLCAVDFMTGKEKWQGTIRFGSMIAADGKLIYIDEKGKLYFVKIDPSREVILKSGQVLRGGKSWTMPVLANGLLYCRNSNGDLVCIKVK